MPARLTLFPPDQPAQRHLLDTGREYLIGRGADCDLRIHDRRLSRCHARLTCTRDRWQIADLESKNGVQLDGHVVSEAPLHHGTWLSIGGVLAVFDLVSEERLAAERELVESRWNTTFDLSRRLDPNAAVDALLGQLLGSVLELADAERAFVMLGGENGELTVRARRARNGSLAADERFPGSTAAVHRAMAEARAVVVCDARADALLGARPSVAAEHIRALVCMPLAIADQPSGVVYLDSSSPGKIFTALDLELLEAFVAQAALVIGVAAVREDLAALQPVHGNLS
jgi:pSer/pThr/pTyr-binding forkhead associated (FHA) protein